MNCFRTALTYLSIASILSLVGCASTPPSALAQLGTVPAPPQLAAPGATVAAGAAAPTPKPPNPPSALQPALLTAKGRVSVTTDGIKGVQQMHGMFELVTDTGGGRLELLTPLGATMAILVWTPTSAVLRRSSGELQSFDSPAEMVQMALGVAVAPSTLVQWLRGEPLDGQPIQSLGPDGFTQLGWRVSSVAESDAAKAKPLSGYPKRIDMARLDGPKAELRLVLDEVAVTAPSASQVDTNRPLAIK